jgi:hypothetical protein
MDLARCGTENVRIVAALGNSTTIKRTTSAGTAKGAASDPAENVEVLGQ